MQASNIQQLRKHHPAWQLLAANKGPLVIGVLQALFKDNPDGIEFDSAVLELSQALKIQQESGELACELEGSDDIQRDARREIRHWIKRGLLLERRGRIVATDALESALRFVQGLDQRIMSSSASRLAIVQREIEHLESSLNANPDQRAQFLKFKIAELQTELQQVNQGHVDVLPEDRAIEAIQEIYALSSSLSNDFRRVEDSYRNADQHLRQSIIAEQNHRGEIVDKLLDSHDQLLNTPEGKVFNGFHQQLVRSFELEKMKQQLRTISNHPCTKKALRPKQQSDLRWLIMRLVMESERVMQARARSEKDVRGFMKTGLAAEHHRVGQLLNEVFAQAININWTSQKTRRAPSPIPPVAIANNGLPLVERLRFKEWKSGINQVLELLPKEGLIEELDEAFWDSFDGLNQAALFEETTALLLKENKNMSIADISQALPPSHDLEAITLWLSMAMASETVVDALTEKLTIQQSDKSYVEFSVPKIAINSDAIKNMDFEI